MEFYFSHFCARSQEEYALLGARIDACAALGRSYEFPNCHMPDGSLPAQATLGFWREREGYLLYLSPPVSLPARCGGEVPLFQNGVQRFPSFQSLAAFLRGLDGGAGPGEPDLYRRLRSALEESVLGQSRAVEAVAFKLYGHICKQTPKRPLSLILYGPTGVGKSELGKQIAPALNFSRAGAHYQFVWTELNTFTEPHSVYRLTGAPPGYVGYEDRPIFEAVQNNPYTVFMFDELEKAHPEVLKVFLSILDEGRCAARREDDQGSRELDFRRCIFLFTTNADLSGAPERRLGFTPPVEGERPAPGPRPAGGDIAGLAQRIFQENERGRRALVRSGVLREIAGRFSGIIGFHALGAETRAEITAKQVSALGREYGLDIAEVSPSFVAWVLARSSPEGALSVRSTVSILEGVLTPLLLAHAGEQTVRWALTGTGARPELRPVPAAAPGGLLPAL